MSSASPFVEITSPADLSAYSVPQPGGGGAAPRDPDTLPARGEPLHVIFFHAASVAPAQCAQVRTVLEALATVLAEDAEATTVRFLTVDAETEALAAVAETYGVVSVPTVAFAASGSLLDRVEGAKADALRVRTERFAHGEFGESKVGFFKRIRDSTHGIANGVFCDRHILAFIKGTPSRPQCGFSRRLVQNILRDNPQRKWGYFNILMNQDVRNYLKIYSEWPTYPQVYVAGEFQGGLDIVQEAWEEDRDFFEKKVAELVDVPQLRGNDKFTKEHLDELAADEQLRRELATHVEALREFKETNPLEHEDFSKERDSARAQAARFKLLPTKVPQIERGDNGEDKTVELIEDSAEEMEPFAKWVRFSDLLNRNEQLAADERIQANLARLDELAELSAEAEKKAGKA